MEQERTLKCKRPLRHGHWLLWPDDDDHEMRMKTDLVRQRLENVENPLKSLPRFVKTHMNGSQRSFNNRHMFRTKLYPFLKFEWGHTYKIYLRSESPYCIGLPNSVIYHINAIFVHYVYRNSVPHAKMFVLETDLPGVSSWLPRRIIGVNELHLFDIRHFSDWRLPADLTTQQSLAQFQKERMDSSGAVNEIVMNAIDRQRTLDRTQCPLPRYKTRLENYGGKKNKNKSRKR